jgi:hypothetical protein
MLPALERQSRGFCLAKHGLQLALQLAIPASWQHMMLGR